MRHYVKSNGNMLKIFLVGSEKPMKIWRRDVSLSDLLKDELNYKNGLEKQEITKRKTS